MTVSKAQQKAVAKYMKNNYDEIKIRVDKGGKAAIKAAADKTNESVNSYIKSAVKAKIKADTGEDIEL